MNLHLPQATSTLTISFPHYVINYRTLQLHSTSPKRAIYPLYAAQPTITVTARTALKQHQPIRSASDLAVPADVHEGTVQ
jgi:hypothetical protein